MYVKKKNGTNEKVRGGYGKEKKHMILVPQATLFIWQYNPQLFSVSLDFFKKGVQVGWFNKKKSQIIKWKFKAIFLTKKKKKNLHKQNSSIDAEPFTVFSAAHVTLPSKLHQSKYV